MIIFGKYSKDELKIGFWKKIEMNIFFFFISAVMAFSLVFKYCILIWLAREIANEKFRSWKPESDMEGRFNRDLIPKVSSNGNSVAVTLSTSQCLAPKATDNFWMLYEYSKPVENGQIRHQYLKLVTNIPRNSSPTYVTNIDSFPWFNPNYFRFVHINL